MKQFTEYSAPQGVRSCWRFWRNCMCTAGWYPIFVAPLVTAGFILSAYSTAGCKLILIDIGFTPSNNAWNQTSEADIGLFFYYDPFQAAIEDNKYIETFHTGCSWYNETFEEDFIDKDRTWKVARVMSLISVAGSFIAALTTWMIIFFPLPVFCIWPAIVLPTSMLAFIAEGSKFLIFDIALCRNAVWFPSGIDSLPTKAETCLLGESAYFGIAAGVVNLLSLLAICLKAPDKRRLDPDFGIPQNRKESIRNAPVEKESDSRQGAFDDDDDDGPSVLDDEIYTPGPSPSCALHMSQENNSGLIASHEDEESSSAGSYESYPSPIKISQHLDNATGHTLTTNGSTAGSTSSSSVNMRISESRLSVMSKMQLSQSSESTDMIDRLVSDLDSSLQDSPIHSNY